MRRDVIAKIIALLIISIFITGCLEEQDSIQKEEIEDNEIYIPSDKAIRMTAREFSSKITTSDEGENITIDFFSLEDGDKIIIVDKISDIYYANNITYIEFRFPALPSGDIDYIIDFQDDLTKEFEIDEKVDIFLTIKHKNFNYAINDKNYNFDIKFFEGQWESEEYFVKQAEIHSPYLYKPLPADLIKKSSMDAYTTAFNLWNTSDILNTYDKNVSSFMTTEKDLTGPNWTDWIKFENLIDDNFSKIRFLAYNIENIEDPVMHCQIKIKTNRFNDYVMVYDTLNGSAQWPDASIYSSDKWYEISFTPTSLEYAMIRFKAVEGYSVNPKLYWFEFI